MNSYSSNVHNYFVIGLKDIENTLPVTLAASLLIKSRTVGQLRLLIKFIEDAS